jgi:hypothetical protein
MPLGGYRDAGMATGDQPPSVITITAESGIDGVEVGRLVAQHCKMRLVAADVAVTVARNTGLPVDVVAELLTRAAPSADDDLPNALSAPPRRPENVASLSKNQVISERRRIITRIAAGGDVVIVCDGAAEVLTGEPRAVHVLLRRAETQQSAQVVPGRFHLVVSLAPERIQATAQQIVALLRTARRT